MNLKAIGTAVTVFAVLADAPLGAPQERVLNGVALDVSCQPIPGVSVSVEHRDPVVSNAHGTFAIAANGTTTVLRAHLAGFRTVERVYRLDALPHEQRLFMLLLPLAEIVAVSPRNDQRVIDPRYPAEQPRLRGRVLDSQCRAIADATVRLASGGGARRTDGDGRFAFDSIASGSHDIEVIAAGFVGTVVVGVRVDAKNGGPVTIPIVEGTPDERVTFRAR
jgi:hypothetical protein